MSPPQSSIPDHAEDPNVADPHWFREPSRREHWFAAGLFVAFGVFFVLFFVVTDGFWFRWVTLGLGLYSVLHGLRHARSAAGAGRSGGG